MTRRNMRVGDCFVVDFGLVDGVPRDGAPTIVLDKAPWKTGLILPKNWAWSLASASTGLDRPVRRIPRWDAPRVAEEDDPKVRRVRRWLYERREAARERRRRRQRRSERSTT